MNAYNEHSCCHDVFMFKIFASSRVKTNEEDVFFLLPLFR
jgi:hypothetical protein